MDHLNRMLDFLNLIITKIPANVGLIGTSGQRYLLEFYISKSKKKSSFYYVRYFTVAANAVILIFT